MNKTEPLSKEVLDMLFGPKCSCEGCEGWQVMDSGLCWSHYWAKR